MIVWMRVKYRNLLAMIRGKSNFILYGKGPNGKAPLPPTGGLATQVFFMFSPEFHDPKIPVASQWMDATQKKCLDCGCKKGLFLRFFNIFY
mmetsp:Transcript_40349/g.68819  ORF Transcript_40349/g.68819 Transcript_40349/m.68819 type:complete len:91 (-) Transcript_40349:273-545(-)